MCTRCKRTRPVIYNAVTCIIYNFLANALRTAHSLSAQRNFIGNFLLRKQSGCVSPWGTLGKIKDVHRGKNLGCVNIDLLPGDECCKSRSSIHGPGFNCRTLITRGQIRILNFDPHYPRNDKSVLVGRKNENSDRKRNERKCGNPRT